MSMYSIAIDGPAGAGKSTIAKAIAEDIGFIYVDTGAMYRAIALYFLRKGIDGHDRKLVAAECPNIHVTLEYDEEGKQQVILNGENITGFIRQSGLSSPTSIKRCGNLRINVSLLFLRPSVPAIRSIRCTN